MRRLRLSDLMSPSLESRRCGSLVRSFGGLANWKSPEILECGHASCAGKIRISGNASNQNPPTRARTVKKSPHDFLQTQILCTLKFLPLYIVFYRLRRRFCPHRTLLQVTVDEVKEISVDLAFQKLGPTRYLHHCSATASTKVPRRQEGVRGVGGGVRA